MKRILIILAAVIGFGISAYSVEHEICAHCVTCSHYDDALPQGGTITFYNACSGCVYKIRLHYRDSNGAWHVIGEYNIPANGSKSITIPRNQLFNFEQLGCN